MVASVTGYVTNKFVKSIGDGYSIDSFNELMSSIEDSLNSIVSKIKNRGFYMDDVALDRATSVVDMLNTLNSNVEKINRYIVAINSALSDNYMLGKEILSAMEIKVVNSDAISSLVVYDDRLEVNLDAEQTVTIKKGEVSSTMNGDTQTIIHA